MRALLFIAAFIAFEIGLPFVLFFDIQKFRQKIKRFLEVRS